MNEKTKQITKTNLLKKRGDNMKVNISLYERGEDVPPDAVFFGKVNARCGYEQNRLEAKIIQKAKEAGINKLKRKYRGKDSWGGYQYWMWSYYIEKE